MAYEKRVYTPGEEVVTYEDMNRIEEGIFNNAEAITALEDKNTEQDTAISEKVKVNNVSTNVNFIRDENGNISKILVDNEEINLAGKLSATTVQDEIWEVI